MQIVVNDVKVYIKKKVFNRSNKKNRYVVIKNYLTT